MNTYFGGMMESKKMVNENGEEALPLFEKRSGKGSRIGYVFSASTIFVAIIMIWVYRMIYMPKTGEPGRWIWIGTFMSEIIFSFYWFFTQALRFNVVNMFPFKDRLSLRYEERLPGVDVFVCTADPTDEPPSMVINTVLSAMAYNYPSQKLSIYLSDDGGSEFTFYALLEASEFAKYWLPFCKKFNLELRAPAAYFSTNLDFNVNDDSSLFAQEWSHVKKLYEEMKNRIDRVTERKLIPQEIKQKHKGFSEWNSGFTKNNHQSVVQIIISEKPHNFCVDIDGHQLPTLVYLSREKRPQRSHNFKAGSMNALIRVSGEITNAPIILNLDCDMYSNDADTIREALCFFMDEKQGYKTSYVQFPQRYHNINKNDTYSCRSRVTHEIELAGMGGSDAALYCGTGCFHRRISLCGQTCSEDNKNELLHSTKDKISDHTTVQELEEASKLVADCSYEDGTQWGKEMGLVYGFVVEDIVTGLRIQCRGWIPVYYDPSKYAFLGMAPVSLEESLVQFKRWSEGMFQIFLSKYCPFIYGHGRIKVRAQMGYSVYLLWAFLSLPSLYYAIVPALSLLHHLPLFPKVSTMWFLPFAYIFITRNVYSLIEALNCNDTIKSWCNTQRMLLFRRTTCFFFAFVDAILEQLGFSKTKFVVTPKAVDDAILKRYEQETYEFGSTCIMFIMISTIAFLNIIALVWGIKMFLLPNSVSEKDGFEQFVPQMLISGLLVIINVPVYQALFFRSDKGHLPSPVFWKSIFVTSVLLSLIPI